MSIIVKSVQLGDEDINVSRSGSVEEALLLVSNTMVFFLSNIPKEKRLKITHNVIKRVVGEVRSKGDIEKDCFIDLFITELGKQAERLKK